MFMNETVNISLIHFLFTMAWKKIFCHYFCFRICH